MYSVVAYLELNIEGSDEDENSEMPTYEEIEESIKRLKNGRAPGEDNITPEMINPLNAELNPICHLLALLGAHFLHVSRIRVKSLTLRLLMSHIYIWSTNS